MKNQPDKNQFQKSHRKRPELLAPAGSFQACKAAIFAGADAVYVGGSQFGARAYAANFTQEELLEAIDFVHLHGKKLYLTVNTLLKQTEMESLHSYLLPYYLQGLDAAIVQDFGVMQLVYRRFPKLPIHVSTQMSVAGAYGFSYLQKWGAARIVPARELSLDEIHKVRSQSDVEIECFVHGALCYCYSGQCLLSSMLGGRSGNRGRCAQPCRLPYTVLGGAFSGKGRKSPCYPLSPKDLCTVGQIPQLIEAGIDSFKVEGRMKSAEYAASIIAIYRKYIDQYLEKGIVEIQQQDYARLLHAGNRSGFTDGYYRQHNGPDMIAIAHPGHEKDEAANLDFLQGLLQEKKIPVRAEAYLKVGEPAMLTVTAAGHSVSVQHGQTQAAKNQPMGRGMIVEQLSKTGNTPFAVASMDVHMDGALFLPKQVLNQLRRDALDQLKGQILQCYRRPYPDIELGSDAETANRKKQDSNAEAANRKKQDSNAEAGWQKKQDSDAAPSDARPGYRKKQPMLGLVPGREETPKINPMAKETMPETGFTAAVEEEAQLFAVLGQDFISRVYLDSSMYTHTHFATQLKEHAARVHAAGKQAYLILPPVFRSETARFYREQWQSVRRSGIDGYLVKSQDELGFLEQMREGKGRCVLDHSLYAYSDYTKSCYVDAGWPYDTIPLELNKKELRARENTASELIIYGHMPLMTSAQCLLKTFGRCEKARALCYLKDRYAKEFPVRNVCNECYNTIYNPQPLSLIQLADELRQLHPAAYRLWFTVESEGAARQVLNSVKASFFGRQAPDMEAIIGAYTNGHYKRGVK